MQSLAQNLAEAYYRLEPFLRAAVRTFVRQHLDTFAENEDGSDKHVRRGGAAGGGAAGSYAAMWLEGSHCAWAA